MDEDQMWAAIDGQREKTIALLARLSDEEWVRPSLCSGWTVRDVAAHLSLQQVGLSDALRMAARYRGGLNRIIHDSACDKAALPTGRLIDEIRAMIGSRRHNLGLSGRQTLINILVHGQDIAVPLGRKLEMEPVAAAFAASSVWSSLGTPMAKVFRPVPWRGFRFVATDADWAAGQGREVLGPIAAILLLLTGRPAALDALAGDGKAHLEAGLTRVRP